MWCASGGVWLQRTFSFASHIQNACCDFNRAHVRYSIVQLQQIMVEPGPSPTHAILLGTACDDPKGPCVTHIHVVGR